METNQFSLPAEHNVVIKDMCKVFSSLDGLTEISFAEQGSSKFNRSEYFKEISADQLKSLLNYDTNLAFLAECDELSINANIECKTFRQSKNQSIPRKSIISFDIDFKDFIKNFKAYSPEKRQTMIESIGVKVAKKASELKIPIWILNSSGNGLHIHFKRSTPLNINSTKEYKESYLIWIKLLQQALGNDLAFDSSCSNPARIMRLPTSTNWKAKNSPAPTTIIFHNPEADASGFLQVKQRNRAVKCRLTLDSILKYFNYKKMETLKEVNGQKVCSSPFSTDSTPSFYFYEDKQVFYDFSVSSGGSVIDLVGKLANLDPSKDRREILQTIDKISGKPKTQKASRFFIGKDGLWYGKSIEKDSQPIWICSPIEVKAATRDKENEAWGRILSFPDQDGKIKTWLMPMELLAGDGLELRKILLSKGLKISSNRNARSLLLEYLLSTDAPERACCVRQIGWHENNFIMPNSRYGKDASDIYLQRNGDFSCFHTQGTLDEWKTLVAEPCKGNSRLIFSLSAAFAPPLLKPIGQESGGFHFVGSSSIGKTLMLRLASSVWGGGGVAGYLRKWRSTVNGLESLAEDRNDCLLTLDEISEISAKDAALATYMLANGSGKKRMTKEGYTQESAEWRTLFLSSGELSLSQHLMESGEKHRGGQFVRLIEIEADAGKNLGIFDKVPKEINPSLFADKLRLASEKLHGTPIDHYLKRLVDTKEEELISLYSETLKHISSDRKTGQYSRVQKRFALVATGGVLAAKMDILPFPEIEVIESIKKCFKSWVGLHSDHPDFESDKIISSIRHYLQTNGTAHFPIWNGNKSEFQNLKCLGYRIKNDNGCYSWLILNEVMRNEVCKGFDFRKAIKVLKDNKFLLTKNNKSSIPLRLPQFGLVRVYQINSDILCDTSDIA